MPMTRAGAASSRRSDAAIDDAERGMRESLSEEDKANREGAAERHDVSETGRYRSMRRNGAEASTTSPMSRAFESPADRTSRRHASAVSPGSETSSPPDVCGSKRIVSSSGENRPRKLSASPTADRLSGVFAV